MTIISSFRYGPLSMDAPVKKVREKSKLKPGEKPGAAAKVTPEQVWKQKIIQV